MIDNHPRLFRALHFENEDYDYSVSEIVNQICEENPELIDLIIDHFDVALWYEQKEPLKYKRIFEKNIIIKSDFWEKGYIKAFISHLASNKEKVTALKEKLKLWGISSFVAHTDIKPSREWMIEIEKALVSMEILIAVVEENFCNSKWTDQEVGYALGRNIDIIPLRVGYDPYGFMGKYQGIQAKGKMPEEIAIEIVKTLVRKSNYRDKFISSFCQSIKSQISEDKIEKIQLIDSWNLLSDEQIVTLLEGVLLAEHEKKRLKSIIDKYGAFAKMEPEISIDSDIPF